MDNRQPVSLSRRLLSYLVCGLVAFQPLLPAFSAAITPVTPGTKLDAAANGVPVLNIATPNGAGISHNQYQQYNVGQEGLILNNATGQLNSTQLGGLIQNNPNLKAGHEAQAIINEVTGANRSQLQGYTEVAGKAANVMVANPYGITCNGCGFINTPNVTLTTGKPQLDANGNLSSLDVTKGSITVEGKGLDGSQSDALSIIARATEINAGIHAKDLTVTTGANRVGADGSVTPIAGEGAAPSVAVDTGALGGMYANRIHLVSSEKGVGVNLGNLVAKQGDIQLNASGKLVINNSLSRGALTAQGTSVTLNGENKASGQITVAAQQDATLSGTQLVSDAGIAVSATGNLTSGNSSLTAGRGIKLNGASITADKLTIANAGDDIQLQANNQLSNSGQFTAGKALSATAQQISNGGMLTGSVTSVNAGGLQNSSGATIAGSGSLTFSGRDLHNQGVISAPVLTIDSVTTSNHGLLQGTNALSFTGSSFNNQAGGTLSSNNSFALNLPDLYNSGLISSGATLSLGGQNLTNNGEINAADLTASTVHLINQQGGSLLAEHTLQLTNDSLSNNGKVAATQLGLNSAVIDNNGTLQAKQALQAEGERLTNSGRLLSDGQLAIASGNLLNSGMLQGQQLTLRTNDWQNSGNLLSLGDADLIAATLNNTGSILSQQALQLAGASTDNDGLIQGTHALRFSADRLINRNNGTVSSDNSFALNLPEFTNYGLITSGASLTLEGNSLTNAGEINASDITANNLNLSNRPSGLLLADRGLNLNNASLGNAGQMAADRLSINSGVVDNSGMLQGKQSLQTHGQQLTNSGTLLSGGQLTTVADRLDNSGLVQGQQLKLTARDWLNRGNALSAADAELTAETLSNSGKILGQQQVQLQAGKTDNSGWLMAQVLTLQSDLINSGLIQGNNALTLKGDRLVNQTSGQLLTAGNLQAQATTLDNQGSLQASQLGLTLQNLNNAGSARADAQFTADVSGSLVNSGTLLSEHSLDLHSSEISNSGSLAADRLSVTAAQLTNAGLLQGNSALTLDSKNMINASGGQLISGSDLDLAPAELTNNGLLQVAGNFSLTGRDFSNSGQLTAASINAQLNGTLNNNAAGLLFAQQRAEWHADRLDNAGTFAAQQLSVTGDTLNNQGLLQGDAGVSGDFRQLNNLSAGQILSGGELMLKGVTASNQGVWQGNNLTYHFDSLTNSGTVNGFASLSGSSDGLLDNRGDLRSGGSATLAASTLLNSGKMMADNLDLRGDTLENRGLWQGSAALDIQANGTLAQYAGGKALTAGDLWLQATRLETAGTLQGDNLHVSAGSWQHQGSLLSSSGLMASVSGELSNSGELLSQGTAQVNAQSLVNKGSLLAEKAVNLNGGALNNSGTVQGDTLTITPANVTNQGSLIGLQSLTLAPAQTGNLRMRVAQAQPARVITNNAGGKLLTQGTLQLQGDAVTNNGTWQGQQILLEATSLTHGGAIQSADGLQFTLRDTLTSTAGSKITANGTAALNALNFANQGQWIAQNLSLQGVTLNNSGAISGVNALGVTLSGALSQQQNSTLLTGGKLALQAAAVNNGGQIQGKELILTSGAVDNNGRVQGDSSLLLTASGRLTNNANGILLSQNGLTLTTPELYNYGLIQGATSRITAYGLANNSGKLLSSADITLTTPQLTNSGWLQAAQLILNADNASNSGTLLADQQGTLTGTQLQNQGTAQGGNLTVNYAQLTNGGTLLGVNQLNVKASQVTQQASGKLFSGGNLLLESHGFDQLGQVVALGDAALQLVNGFISRNILAAGNHLSIVSNGAIDNQATLQGQAVTLSAGGDLTNNGQITTGTGDSSLSGSRIMMNGAGSLQGGGNVTLSSRSDVDLNGFTGTRGNLTITSPGNIVNTALLYAGQNLYLFANSIRNQQADILAGNSLWMQRDATGNANGEVVNNSGTIETQNGDITINTGHLLNTREGLNVTQTSQVLPTHEGVGNATIRVNVSELPDGSYGYYTTKTYTESGGGCSGADGGCSVHTTIKNYYAPFAAATTQKFALSSSTIDVVSNGAAGRISSGRDMSVHALSLENQASDILANQNISLSGDQFNNQSWQAGTQNDYAIYQYKGTKPTNGLPTSGKSSSGGRLNVNTESNNIIYTLTGNESSFTPGQLFRAVIQAGGNVSASFNGDISNTSNTANAGWTGNTLSVPSVKGLTALSQASAAQRQTLTGSNAVAVNSPEWRDQLRNALQQINGGVVLDNTKSAEISLSAPSGSSKDLTGFGKAESLAGGDIHPASLHDYQLSNVDTSAYPLPTSDNGYFVTGNSQSPYLITINPELNGLGQLDSSLFGDLNALLGKQPGSAPQETRQQYTDVNTFPGSSYLLDRLSLKPDYDYRFLGDAAFDTRYVSNTVLNQTGSRYLNGIGTDLDQMRYLMDNAAAAQQSLGLQFGVSLTAEQVASLDKSLIWWEAATVNGQTVMVPKVYLSPKDVDMHDGSVIAGNNVTLSGSNIINDGSTLTAQNALSANSQNRIDNLNAGLISAGGDLQLSAISTINNVSSTISGKKVALESVDGNINSITISKQWTLDAGTKSFSDTFNGNTAAISADDTLSLKAGNNITLTAATLNAGGNVLLDAWNDIAINANQQVEGKSQKGEKRIWLRTENTSDQKISNIGSQIAAGGNLTLKAGHDLGVTASTLEGKGDTTLAAGNNLNLNSAVTGQNTTKGNKETHDSGSDRTSIVSGGNLSLSAGHDLTSQASALAANDDIHLQAGRDINLNAQENRSGNSERGSKKTIINETVRQQGTEIISGGSATLLAGNNITSQASTMTANNDLVVQAGHDVNITSSTESDYAYKEETKTKKGLFSKKTTHTISEESSTVEKGSQLSGDRVSIIAGNDLTVKGSSVIGESDVGLKAGNDLTLAAATESQTRYRLSETKKSGMLSSGGIGVTFGSASSKQQLKLDGTTQSQSASTVGSTGGNVTLVAGRDAHVAGSDVIAKQDISLVGGSVTIDPGNDTLTRRQSYEQKQSGLTLQLTSPITDALLSLGSQAKEAGQAGDDRLKALNAVKMLESGWAMSGAAGQSATALANGNMKEAGIKIALSVGASKSKSSSEYNSNTVSGSSLSGGGSVAVVATGGNGTSGNLTLAGSGITGNNVTLAAAHDLNLVAASNNTEQQSSNNSSGWSAGVHIAIGQRTGIGVQASGFMASGAENGNSTTFVNSRVNAKDNLTLSSGNDMLLSGAQALGDSISVNAGNNLTLTSLQDTDNYQSKQQSASGGFSFTFGSMTGSAGLSLSKSKINSEYASVGDQSGLFAGDGGYDIYAGNHTQLNGAVIASTADAADNRLSTGTLGWDSIGNHAEYHASSTAIGISGGYDSSMASGQQFGGGALPAVVNMSGSASGTTHSAVADGSLTVRDTQRQTQDVAGLSHDTDNANGHIDKIFNKENVASQMAFAQGVQELAGKVVGDVRAYKLDAAAKETSDRLLKENPENASLSKDAFSALVQKDAGYKAVAAQWGTGGTYSMVASAVAGALGGLSANNPGAAAGGAMAPYIANAIKKATTTQNADGTENTNLVANTMAHAVAGAVLAQIAGSHAGAGAAGAAGGELAARAIVAAMYPDTDISKLTESQKQTVSTLSQIAAGLAGGIAADSSAGGGAGAGAGKNAVENNFLGATSSDKLDKAVEKIKQGDKSLAAANELIKLENADKRSDALVSKFTKDSSQMSSTERAELAGYLRVYAAEMEKEYGSAVSQELVKGLLSGQDYIKRNPDSEVMAKAQSIMNTWGYHKSNASIGDAPLIFGGSVLGLTVKGMATNATIGVGVNTGVQLAGKDPFSYVDVIMAGITAAATTGKGIIASTPVNMGGAAIGGSIKGENPVNSMVGAGAGTVAGGIGGIIIKGVASKVTEEAVSDLTGAIGGSYIAEKGGNYIKGQLDGREENDNKK